MKTGLWFCVLSRGQVTEGYSGCRQRDFEAVRHLAQNGSKFTPCCMKLLRFRFRFKASGIFCLKTENCFVLCDG